MVVGATDRLPVDSHSDGRWITKPVTAATGRLEEMPEVTTKVETTADEYHGKARVRARGQSTLKG